MSNIKTENTSLSLLFGAVLVFFFGVAATMTAISAGWGVALLFGAVFLFAGWKLAPTGLLQYMSYAFGVLMLLGALFNLLI